ncbi:MAG: hypothetical protein VYD57_13455 [Pseudomonadota bacterium]|nr:hypothetical protein [Pseudomonadota bacterium]
MTKPKANIPAEVPAAEMARFLQISVRQLQALSRRGTLPKTSRDSYPMKATADAYFAHQIAEVRRRAGSTSTDALREQRTEEIGRRMRKEEKNLVMLDEALEVFDELTVAFIDTFDQLEKHLPEAPAEIADEKARFQVSAARIRRKLVNGNDDAVENGQAEPESFDDGDEDQ